MSSRLTEVLQSLKGSRDSVIPSSQVFPLLDVEQLATEMRLDVRGTEDGRANVPPSSESFVVSLDGDVRDEMERRASRALNDYQVQLDLYEGRVKRGLLAPDLRTAIEAAGERALADFCVQATDDLGHLDAYRREVIGRDREFSEFRQLHGLSRLPVTPTPRSRLFRWLVIVLVVLIESIVNGMFFARGSTAGLIGGGLQALVLALFNVALGLAVVQLALPLMNHVRPHMKIAGAVAAGIYLPAVVALNLSIAHFRDLYVQFEGNVPLSALALRLREAPLGLSDVDSIILAALGILFNLLVAIDAYGLKDPYWGYSAVGQRREAAVGAYTAVRSVSLDDLTSRRDDAIGEMSKVIEEIRNKEQDLQLALNGKARLYDQFSAYSKHLQDVQCRLVQRYREANIKARSTAIPEAFKIAPAALLIPEPERPAVDLAVDREALRHVVNRMEFFIRELSREYGSQAQRYEPVNVLLKHSERSNA